MAWTCLAPARGCPHGDQVHVPYRLGLGDETKQIGGDLRPVANHERRVAEFMDQERVVQGTNVASVPEFRQLIDNPDVVLLCAG